MSGTRLEDCLLTEHQVATLYREILVPWERTYAAVTTPWSELKLDGWPSSDQLTVESVTSPQIDVSLQSLLDDKVVNFFVLARSKSKARDLYRHTRNAIAHAGVTRHQQSSGPTLIRFKAPGPGKKSIAMVGQLAELLLPALLASLNTTAKNALEASEA